MKIKANLIFEINNNSIHTKKVLIKQNITILLQAIVIWFEIWYFKNYVIYLLYCLIIFKFKNKYFLIFYYKYF